MEKTDYVPDEGPVPVGTWVFYRGSRTPGVYRVASHMDPSLYPDFPPGHRREEVFPDGVAYELWPVGISVKLGNAHLSVVWARRTSFRINANPELLDEPLHTPPTEEPRHD
jgi:hypothetical protein